MRDFLARIPFHYALIFALSLGLAPFTPEPHVWEKLKMLAAGSLSRPIDIFDLFLHGAPWVVLMLKVALGQFSMRAPQD
ncbi:MAG: RND transporter [Anaerolineae bacterium]